MSRYFTRVAAIWAVALVTIIDATGCNSSRAQLEGSAAPAHELLVEIAVRAIAPEILPSMLTSNAERPPLRVDWSETAPIVKLYEDKDGLVHVVLNATFWKENDQLLEATALAEQLNARARLRQFAITRARKLRDKSSPLPTESPDTFWEEEGLNEVAFAHLRELPEFQSRVRVFRRQAVAWHLARAAARDLPATSATTAEPNVSAVDRDRLAANVIFEVLGSPFPPMVTGLLTAGVEPTEEQRSSSEILCGAAHWVALGVDVLRENESFQQRLAHNERLQTTLDRMLKGLSQLRQEGRCDFQL